MTFGTSRLLTFVFRTFATYEFRSVAVMVCSRLCAGGPIDVVIGRPLFEVVGVGLVVLEVRLASHCFKAPTNKTIATRTTTAVIIRSAAELSLSSLLEPL